MKGSNDVTQQGFEEQLSAGLQELAAEAEVPAIEAIGITRPLSTGGSDQRSFGRRNGAWLLAAAVAAIAAGAGIAAIAGNSGSQEVATGSEQTREPTVAQPAPADIERFAMDETIGDLRLSNTVDSVALGEPNSIFEYHLYGTEGEAVPGQGAPRVTIFRVDGPLAPPLIGDEVDLGNRMGIVEADGTVGFEADGATIRVLVSGLNTSSIDLAAALDVDAEGQVVPLAEPPDGLALLGTVRSGLFVDLQRSVPLDGHAALYDGDGGRWLTVSSEPSYPNDLTALAWLSESATAAQVDGRSVVMTTDGDVRSAAWVEGGSLVRVVGHLLTADELEQAVSLTAAVDQWPGTGPSDGPVEVTGPTGDTSDLAGAERVLATVVPQGFGLILAADNADLGDPWYSAKTYVWADEETEQPTAEDASVIMTVAGSVPAFAGEPIDIAGAPGVLIDREATNAPSDLFVTHLDGTATFAANNVPIDDLIELATAWVESGEAEPPTGLANGMVNKITAEGAGWQGHGGPSGISGTPLGTVAVYQDRADPSRVLGVQSSPIEGSGGVDYVRWTFPDAVQTVEVAGDTALVFEPAPGYAAVRFLSGDRLIVVWGENLTLDEILPTADTLRPADDGEWDVGL